jgi:hypothetical protein
VAYDVGQNINKTIIFLFHYFQKDKR